MSVPLRIVLHSPSVGVTGVGATDVLVDSSGSSSPADVGSTCTPFVLCRCSTRTLVPFLRGCSKLITLPSEPGPHRRWCAPLLAVDPHPLLRPRQAKAHRRSHTPR